MSWETSPRSWTAKLMTSWQHLNTEVRDRMNYLFDRPKSNFKSTVGYTTSSSSYSIVNANYVLTHTSKSGNVEIVVMGYAETGGTTYFDVSQGATRIGATNTSEDTLYTVQDGPVVIVLHLFDQPTTVQTYRLWWKTASGTANLRPGAIMSVREMS